MPLLETRRIERPSRTSVANSTQPPPGRLYAIALSSRLATSRSVSAPSPSSNAGSSATSQLDAGALGAPLRAASSLVDDARGRRGSRRSTTAWLRASVRSASISRSCCSPAASTRSQHSPQRLDRCLRIGKRDLDERPLERHRRAQLVGGVGDEPPLGLECPLQAAPAARRRSAPALQLVVARRRSPSRSCRLCSVIWRARAFIVRSGTSARPANSQPSPIESSAMIASAIPDSVSRVDSLVRARGRQLELSLALELDGDDAQRPRNARDRHLCVRRAGGARHVAQAASAAPGTGACARGSQLSAAPAAPAAPVRR